MKISTFVKHGLVIAGLLCATFQATAQAPAGGGGGAARGGMGVLTQEQRAKLRETTATEIAPLREKLVAAQKEAAKSALADKADVKEKIVAVQQIQTEMALVQLKGLKAIASTLTAEQKTALENSRDGGYSMLLGGFGGFGGMGGGGRGGAGGGAGGAGGGGPRNN